MNALLMAGLATVLAVQAPSGLEADGADPPLLAVRCEAEGTTIELAAVPPRDIAGQMKLCRLFGGKVRGVVKVDA